VFQIRPNTRVVIYTELFMGIGFSKAHWPDKWDSDHGIDMVRRKAVAHVVRQILKEEEASGT